VKQTERFSNRVANYVKYRPGYPPEMLDLFRDEMNLQTSSIIADVGSGTGISAKFFLENNNRVFGVEPNEAMRNGAESFLKESSNFKSVDGTSEHTTLKDKSVDFVIAAQAFHWFDKAKTRIEFKRILRENGWTALIWNERQLDSNDFLREYERFLVKFGTDYAQVRHENISNAILEAFFQNEFQKATFQNLQILDFEGLKGRMLSASYMPSEENPRFEEMMTNLKEIFTKYERNNKIEIIYDTNIYYGQL
jgi:ubiquinone/menaquinone biosynthesis C-methylase UbiE